MDILIVIVIFIAIIIMGICMYVGLDLKKLMSWLYGLLGLLCGLLIGFTRDDLIGGLKLGALFAFGILYGGAVMRWHRQRYSKKN